MASLIFPKIVKNQKNQKIHIITIAAPFHCSQAQKSPQDTLSAMLHQKVSDNMKEMALYLLMEAGWEIESIAVVLGVSVKSIEQWEDNYATHG